MILGEIRSSIFSSIIFRIFLVIVFEFLIGSEAKEDVENRKGLMFLMRKFLAFQDGNMICFVGLDEYYVTNSL